MPAAQPQSAAALLMVHQAASTNPKGKAHGVLEAMQVVTSLQAVVTSLRAVGKPIWHEAGCSRDSRAGL